MTGTHGNISADPLFFDLASNDFHLCFGSPAIDAGDSTSIVQPDTDLDGNPRLFDGNATGTAVVDIGAYEYNPESPLRASFEVDKASGTAPLSVQFKSLVTAEVTDYLWDFGDGTTSTQANPSHAFDPGTYTVSLTVTGPGGSVSKTETNQIDSLAAYTLNASATGGGTITPAGETTVVQGGSLTYNITPNPSYQLTALTIDGTVVAGPSPYPFAYTLSDVTSGHVISAVFTHYFDYFGIQAGNHFVSQVTSGSSVIGTATDDISLDMTSFAQPSYIDLQASPLATGKVWYQINSSGVFMKQMISSGYTFTFDPALLMISTPLAAGANWTANSSVTVAGRSGTATITAKVSPQVIISIPAGHFLAWPIAYTLRVSGPAGTTKISMTEWFAPYFGTVKEKDSKANFMLVQSEVGGGTSTAIPPIVTGTSHKSAARGTSIQIAGYQFASSQGTSAVRIGSVDCDEITSWTDNSIECIVPDTAVSGPVTVVTDTWTSNSSVVLTVLIPPVLTGVNPTTVERGSSLQLLGQDFGTTLGKVKIGSATAKITQWGDTVITCTVPVSMRPGIYSVTVTDSQGQGQLQGALTVTK